MAWYPDAIARPIPPGSNDPRIIPVGIVLHVDAGNAASLYDYFNGPSGGIESHFHVQRDGDVEQYRDTESEADANYDGNSWFSGGTRYGLLSVETQGFEHGEWTDAQLASIKDLIRWASREHGFPMQVAPSWQGPGVGYHVMFGAPGRWTPVAKSCPGPDRIEQFHDIITPWLESGGGTVSYDDVWRTDGKMRAPEGRDNNGENQHWWPENVLENIADFTAGNARFRSPYLRTEVRSGKPARTRWLIEWAWHYAKGARQNAAEARSAARDNGRQIGELAAQVSALSSAVEQLAAGGIDLAAVQEAAEAGAAEAWANAEVSVTFADPDEPEDDSHAEDDDT